MKSILFCITGLVVGFALGYLVFHHDAEPDGTRPVTRADLPIPGLDGESPIGNTGSALEQQISLYTEATQLDWETAKARLIDGMPDPNNPWRSNYSQDRSSMFLTRLLELDPERTLGFLAGSRERSLSQVMFHRAFCQYVQQDLEASIAYFLDRMGTGQVAHSIASGCFAQVADVAALEASPNYSELKPRLDPSFEQVIQHRRVQEMPPWEAFEQARREGSNMRNSGTLIEAGRRWAEVDLTGYLKAVSEMPAGNDRANLIANTLDEALNADLLGTLRRLEELDLAFGHIDHRISNAMRNRSFEEARSIYEAYVAGDGNPALAAALAGSLAQIDPRAASDYYQTLPRDVRAEISPQVSFQMAAQNPELVLELLLSDNMPFAANSVHSLSMVAQTHPDLILNHIDQIREHENAAQMMSAVVNGLSNKNPEAALELIKDHWDDPAYQNGVFQAVASWARYDPFQAGEFVAEHFAAAGWKQPVVGHVVSSMYRADRERTQDYLDQLPPGSLRLQAQTGLAMSVAHTNLDAAVGILNQVSDGTMRQAAAVRIAAQLISRFPQRVGEITGKLGVSQEEVDRLTRSRGQVTGSVFTVGG